MGKLIAATDKNPPSAVRERPLAASIRGCAGDISTILADWLKMGVFVNVYRAQESIPRNRLGQPM